MRWWLAGLVVVSLSACGATRSPTAPAGSTLSISASPVQIESTGISNITVIARKSTGFPVPTGTVVFLSSSLGVLQPLRAETDGEGVVRATLFGNGAVGQAIVVAAAGAAPDASVTVTIGEIEL